LIEGELLSHTDQLEIEVLHIDTLFQKQ
jgi:hypothetical protein